MSVAAAVLNNTFRGQFVRNGSHVYTSPLFVANWGNDSVDGIFTSAPTSNSDTPTGSNITINGINQVWQARYPFNSDGTNRIDFFPIQTTATSSHGGQFFYLCNTFLDQGITFNTGAAPDFYGIGLTILKASTSQRLYTNNIDSSITKARKYTDIFIVNHNLFAQRFGFDRIYNFDRCFLFNVKNEGGSFWNGKGSSGIYNSLLINEGYTYDFNNNTPDSWAIYNSIIYCFSLKNSKFASINQAGIINNSDLIVKFLQVIPSKVSFSNFLTGKTPIGASNCIETGDNYNSVPLNDFTTKASSLFFRAGSVTSVSHIANAIYGIPIYNTTAFTSKDSSLPTITANGFTMLSFKDFNRSSGTIGLNFRISQINLVGAEDLTIDFTDLDSSGNFTLGANHDAPTDETGATNDGTGDHKTGFVGGYFTFRKADGTTVLSSKFLPFNQPIGFDDTGKIWGDIGFAGTVVKVGNRLYSDFVTWTATTFSSGDYVEYEGKPYKANANTLSTDVPGVSSKWDTWNPYIEAAEVQVELKYPNGGGLDFKGITFCLKMNRLKKVQIGATNVTGKSITNLKVKSAIDSELNPTYDNSADEVVIDRDYGWGIGPTAYTADFDLSGTDLNGDPVDIAYKNQQVNTVYE